MTWSETPPNSRYMFANGQSMTVLSWPDLFAVYGTTFGQDDGDHFNLPDFRGRFPQGSHENIGFEVGNTDGLAPENRLARHTHTIAANNDHTHAAGTLQNDLASPPDRAAGGLGRPTQTIHGSTAGAGGHDHGGQTGAALQSDFPHMRVAFHVRVLL